MGGGTVTAGVGQSCLVGGSVGGYSRGRVRSEPYVRDEALPDRGLASTLEPSTSDRS